VAQIWKIAFGPRLLRIVPIVPITFIGLCRATASFAYRVSNMATSSSKSQSLLLDAVEIRVSRPKFACHGTRRLVAGSCGKRTSFLGFVRASVSASVVSGLFGHDLQHQAGARDPRAKTSATSAGLCCKARLVKFVSTSPALGVNCAAAFPIALPQSLQALLGAFGPPSTKITGLTAKLLAICRRIIAVAATTMSCATETKA
jgi:hypothetical protein